MPSREERKLLNDRIARRIRSIREGIEATQAKFADEHLMDRQLLHRWENASDDRGISIHTVLRFCRMAKVTLAEFFDSGEFEDL